MDTIIYGMGGGKMSDESIAEHYPRIVELAQVQFTCEKPQIAIVPTAHFNGTNEKMGRGFMDFTVETFAGLGCKTEQILIGDVPAGQRETETGEIEEILDKSHAVFVLGGDTRYLLEAVRDRELDATFEATIAQGKVMAGSSAGFIWLTKHCMSDAESFHKDEWSYLMLEGLGVLPVAGNAHDNGAIPDGLIPQVSRREQFEEQFMLLGELPGIAVDEFAAIEVRNHLCQVRSPDPAIGAYVLANGKDGVHRRKIDPGISLDLVDASALRDYAFSANG